MFDTTQISTNIVDNKITFNSVGGTLVKSCAISKFIHFHMESELAKCFFDGKTPHKNSSRRYGDEFEKVAVLQVMLCGGDNFLVEYVDIAA